MHALRSMLFTPGHRRDLIAKAARSGADAVVVDLEDAVAPEEKPRARAGLAELPDSPVPYYVRTNGPETEPFWADVVAAGTAGVAGMVIAKVESAELLREVAGHRAGAGPVAGQRRSVRRRHGVPGPRSGLRGPRRGGGIGRQGADPHRRPRQAPRSAGLGRLPGGGLTRPVVGERPWLAGREWPRRRSSPARWAPRSTHKPSSRGMPADSR